MYRLTDTSGWHSTPVSSDQTHPLLVSLDSEPIVTLVVGIGTNSVASGGHATILWVSQVGAGDGCMEGESIALTG